ncbi:MAG TPA: ABC transporter permease, partial [Baekduia sp.]|nr:ABC transporter permease [Baekduia sp.]
MSTALATASPARAVDPRHAGWAGIALGLVAWFITLPPALVRTPVPSVLIGLLAMTAGAWAIGGGERKLGWGAIVAGLAGGIGAWASTQSGVGNLKDVVTWSALVAATLRYATPLIFGALGGIVSERSGVVNVGLEGMMLTGAFFGILGADLLDSWFLGLLVGMVAGGVLASVHAVFSINLRADQVVSGIAINFLAAGLTGYIFIDHYGDQGTPDNVPRVPDVSLPGIKDIGFLGDAIGKASLLTWVALIGVVALAVFLFRTPSGLRLRSVGEHPRAAETVGISVVRTRYVAVIASGVLAAMGGAYLSIGFVGSFNQNMTAGRGFIALAAVIFGN